jgi:transcriptional regulator GlxA family with amidase domain
MLDGKEATTHWGFADMLDREFPEVKVCRDRILVPAGEGHRVVTAGGASAWADLMLYLIARFAGTDEARRIAKIYLIDPHLDGQMTYASLTSARQHEDQLISAGTGLGSAALRHAEPRRRHGGTQWHDRARIPSPLQEGDRPGAG